MRIIASATLLLSCLLSAAPARSGPPIPFHDSRGGNDAAAQSPYFWVRGGDESLDALPLKSTRAEVEISGVIADVKVTQVYRNQGRKPLGAVYVFPGSTRAAVYGMRMQIGERSITARIQDRDAARQAYEQARAQGRTASLLEQQRPNVFQMNVANILPGDEVKVELSYTELLSPTEGTYSFVYPTVVGPRYEGAADSASSTKEPWVASPYTHAGEAPAASFDLRLQLAAGMPIQRIACGTHQTRISYPDPMDAVVQLDPSESQGGNRDFILKYQLAGQAVQSGLLLNRGRDENFFLLLAEPPKRVAPAQMPPREYVFIMDVSGSQMGFPLEVSKVLMEEMIRGLRPQDRFNVMVFEGSSALWQPSSLPATPENTRQALAFVREQSGGGGTELEAALTRALTLPRAERGISRSFVISTDGYISADARVFDTIRRNLGSANLFAFGIGSSVNRHLIEGMAHAGQGEAFVVTDPAQAPAEAERFRAYVSAPVLSQVRLRTEGFQAYDLEPLELPDVLAERPVVCFGKWKGEPTGTVILSGVTGAGPWEQRFEVGRVPATAAHGALRQLWARQRIQLISDYDQFGETEERKREITQLGLDYSLLTAHTSFVAIDSQVRNAGGAQNTVAQPLPMPAGVSDAAVGSVNAPAPVSMARKSYAPAGASAGAGFLADGLRARSTPKILPEEARVEPQSLHKAEVLDVDSKDLGSSPLRPHVEAKLREAALKRLLAEHPAGTVLELRIGADGKVLSAAFNRDFAHAQQALALIRAWHVEEWSGPGVARLRIRLED